MARRFTYKEVKEYVESCGYELISKEYKNNREKLVLKDNLGYFIVSTLSNLKYSKNPKIFDLFNPYTIQNIKLWLQLNNKPFKLLSDKYKGDKKNLKWKCLKNECNEIFKMSWNAISSQKQNCPYCAGRKVGLSNCLATKRPDLALEWHPTKNGDLTPYDVTCYSHKKVWWQCSENSKHMWKVCVTNRSSGNGCPYCRGLYPSEDYNLLVINPEICKEWNYNKNELSPKDYTPSSHIKVWWKCKDCGHEWCVSINSRTNNKTSCPKCYESHGEKEIRKWLDNNKCIYSSQYTFSNLLSDKGVCLRFDFAIFDKSNNLQYLIEYDGQQHFRWIKGMMTICEYTTLLKYDIRKNLYCAEHDIPLIRIPYWEFDNIESILTNWLKESN